MALNTGELFRDVSIKLCFVCTGSARLTFREALTIVFLCRSRAHIENAFVGFITYNQNLQWSVSILNHHANFGIPNIYPTLKNNSKTNSHTRS